MQGLDGFSGAQQNTFIPITDEPSPTTSSPAFATTAIKSSSSSFVSTPTGSSNEASPLYKFNQKRREVIEEQDRESDRKRRETTDKAKTTLASFYQERQQKIGGSQKQNRVDQESLIESLKPNTAGNTWEKVLRLVDLEQKADRKDTSRMRQVMLSMKNTA